ncbi:MAG: class I SAM-dependent methyltransferase [Hyphomonadaceae bacterium]|nr:class I SAM-dependent methyltransferase [Hyphomonadaceae bacterium]
MSYDRYQEWKGWGGADAFTVRDPGYYRAEFRGLPLKGARVIEIGFGDGACLAWLKSVGAEVTGLEIQEGLVALARERGFDARLADDFDWSAHAGAIDLICGFDVLEHFGDDAMADLLRRCAVALKHGGVCLFRTPNGASPFGLHLQHADITHVTPVTGARMRHLLLEKRLDGLTLETWRDQAQSPGKGLGAVRKALSGMMRALTRFIIHNGYLRGEPIPLAQNAVIVLRRTAAPA